MRVKYESEVVASQELRKKIIEEIQGPENQRRKSESYRRHQCNKDRTKLFVLDELIKQFDPETVREMNYSIANLSVSRKIIDKLAKVYANGCKRTGKNDAETKAIEETANLLEMNRKMKTTNRYLRTHKNTVVGILPCPVYDLAAQPGSEAYELKLQAFEPHLYDVIEQFYDREKPMFIITSNYKATSSQMTAPDPATANRGASSVAPKPLSDGRDQVIADKPDDHNADVEAFVWWSKYYHFTTNAKGEFLAMGNEKSKGQVSPDDIVNPIQRLPFYNFAMDQDGSFWAEGGEDIFDGSVHINCAISHQQHIGTCQGYGQFYMRGKNLPKFVKAGVNKAILMEVADKDDPQPEIGFASANPKLQELKEQVVMYVALLLTTNNLSTKAVAAELSGSGEFASGISLIIDKAESIEDVQDQRDVFYKGEPELFEITSAWQQVYKDRLTDAWKQAMLPQDVELNLKFNDYAPIMSEKEKLENMKLRKELGIDSMLDLIMRDNPDMTKEEAEKRLLEIVEAKLKETASAAVQGQPEGELAKSGKYFEDENGDLWEETDDGYRKVAPNGQDKKATE